MTTLKLNAVEMLMLHEVVPPAAPAAQVLIFARMRIKLELSEEQELEAQVTKVPYGQVPGQFSIDCRNPEVRWEVEFTQTEMDLLIDLCRGFDRWPATMDTVRLFGQIGDVTGKAISVTPNTKEK